VKRALWLLLWLRLVGWLRRLRRAVGTVRGVLFGALGLFLFGSWLLSVLLLGRTEPANLDEVRRTAPLAIIAFCILNLILSSGERSITFSPAEVNLLFPAPFSRRQLLLYKIAGSAGASLATALFLTLFGRRYTASLLTGFVGLSLTVLFLQLFSMTLALTASAVGAHAYDRGRKLVLTALVVLVTAVALSSSARAGRGDWLRLLEEVLDSPVVQVVLAPVGWLVRASTAERLWPDLVQWAALGAALDIGLLLLVLGLDAHYLETAATASEKAYARLQRVRQAGPALGLAGGGARLRLPSLPRWGGIGPLAWRQLTTAVRSFWAVVLLLVVFGVVATPMFLEVGRGARDAPPPAALAALLLAMGLFVTTMLPFDFRGDLDRMDLLKALPVPTWRLVLGQLLTPVLLVTLVQMLALAAAQVVWGRVEPALAAAAIVALPFNFLLFAVENLFFLWFPTRLTGQGPGDFQFLGRHMLLWLGRLFVLGMVALAAALAGVLAYFVAGESAVAAVAAACTVVAVADAALVPLLVLAFDHFDVARDLP
jgi:hypothetical protein